MKRTFVTFAAGEIYEKLSKVLESSINSFSEYKLITYKPEDFDIEYKPELWDGPRSINFSYKILSCLKALENYDEVVWLDNDCVVTYNIDKIWNYKVENYPLLPKHRFYNFEVWPHAKVNHRDPNLLKIAKEKIGVDSDFDNIYLQACCMLFNKNCKSFLDEIMYYYKDYDSSIYPFGDETIINLLIWKNKYKLNLGDVFLCSYYFSSNKINEFINLKKSDDYPKIFDKESYNNDECILSCRLGLINNNFNNIMFFHGSKSDSLHNSFLTNMVNKKMNETIKITAILLNWKRPENIVKTIKSIRNQSIPIKICLWNNNPDDKTRYDVDLQIDSPDNFKCYPRWMMASLLETDYLFTLDDDLILSDSDVIKDTLDFYESIKNNMSIVGYTGVILNENKDYWSSEHIKYPKDTNTIVDIIKGRFMFMNKNLIKNINLENEETCEDIKVSSYSNYKVIPSILKNRLSNLDELGVGLFGSNDHNLKRSLAAKKYFTNNVEIKDLMNKYGSDKGGCGRFSCHNYTNLYQLLFNNIKNNNLNIFELGIGTNNSDIAYNMGSSGKPGASLKAWKEFLPNSMIYGADIDNKILFNEYRIKTFYCDQTNPKVIKEMWDSEDLKNVEFDFIIDDGLHEFDANITFFENSLHKLKRNGYFIIEDLKSNTLSTMKKYISDAEIKYNNFEFSLFELYLHNNQNDNNILVIRRIK